MRRAKPTVKTMRQLASEGYTQQRAMHEMMMTRTEFNKCMQDPEIKQAWEEGKAEYKSRDKGKLKVPKIPKGRHPRYDEIKELIECGKTEDDIANLLGLTFEEFKEQKRTDPQLRSAIASAKYAIQYRMRARKKKLALQRDIETKQNVPKPSIEEVADKFKLGLSLDQIAESLGISRSAFDRIRQEDPRYDIEMRKAKAEMTRALSTTLHKKALAGNVGAAAYLLKTKHGFKDTTTVEITPSDSFAKIIRGEGEADIDDLLTTDKL